MAIREDLVSSAVTFLQDPSVANAPVDKRIAFLQSKNLTKEEVDAALARAGEGSSAQVVPANYQYAPQQVTRQPPPYAYSAHPPAWPNQPPEVPRRDWRDYFIMATVMGGLGYGAYQIATRYIVPLIKPPTPPQLEQDKAAIDTAFTRAFELIEQLSKDTAVIKSSEEARTEKLDAAVSDMETAVNELKQASRRRDDDTRRIGDEVRSLQSAIPKAIKSNEENTDQRIRELQDDIKSLRKLLSNRVGTSSPAPSATRGSVAPAVSGASSLPSKPVNGASTHSESDAGSEQKPAAASGPAFGSSRFASSPKGGIPAWQLAASRNSEADSKKDTAESGTVTETST